MTNRTGVLIGIAALGAALAPAALAGPPAVACHVLEDWRDDQVERLHPSLDIRSGDVASNRDAFTAVLRLGAAAPEPTRTAGSTYELRFQVGTDMYRFAAARLADGDSAILDRATGTTVGHPAQVSVYAFEPVATPAVTFDAAKSEVRWTVPMSAFGGALPPGTPLEWIRGATSASAGTAKAGGDRATVRVAGDDASRSTTYRVGEPSCVKPGA